MVTLTYGSLSMTLRNPDFENVDRIEVSRISRKTRGGDLVIYRDPAWPTTRSFDLKFSFLSEIQTRNLLRFLDQSLGQNIVLVDWEGRSWTGIITTPLAEVTQPGRENKTAHFLFQGVLT